MKTMAKTEEKIFMEDIGKFRIEEPFDSLACARTESSVHANTRTSINMELKGLDPSEPLIVWRGRNIIIAGQDKYRLARHKGYKEIPVIEKDFNSEDEAVEYLRHLRRDGADFTDADIFIWVEYYGERGKRGRPPKNVSDETISAKLSERVKIPKNESIARRFNPYHPPERWGRELRSAHQLFHIARYQKKYKRNSERLADLLGIDKNKVDRVWYILDHGDELDKDYVRRGFVGINAAYNRIRGFKAGINFYTLNFQDVVVRIPVKMDEELKLESFKWVILGTGEAPDMEQLPEGSKIYYMGEDRPFPPIDDHSFVIPRKIIRVDVKKTNMLLLNNNENVEDE